VTCGDLDGDRHRRLAHSAAVVPITPARLRLVDGNGHRCLSHPGQGSAIGTGGVDRVEDRHLDLQARAAVMRRSAIANVTPGTYAGARLRWPSFR
jgi:hypothetical protein